MGKAWGKMTPEEKAKHLEYMRQWRLSHKEQARRYCRDFYQRKGKAWNTERQRKWRESNPEHVRAYKREYHHRPYVKAKDKERQAMKLEIRRQTREFWKEHQKSAFEYVAWSCGGEDDFFEDLDRRLGLKD